MNFFTKVCFGTAISAAATTAAMAGSSISGKLTNLASLSSGVVIFTAGAHTGAPACASVSNEWAVDTSTAEGKAAYAILLTAVTTDKPVNIVGAADCRAWPDRERAQQVFLGL